MKVDLEIRDLIPAPTKVLEALRVPPGGDVSKRLHALVGEALDLLETAARPAAMIQPVDAEEFATVLEPTELNALDPVITQIYPRADALALFAATLGSRVSDEIDRLFARQHYPLAVALDAAASRMAEALTEVLADGLLNQVAGLRRESPICVLGYSPGYCGWHITGQRTLFAHLGPQEIGVTLSENCLMHPLKSVSGVLVAAPAAVHRFRPGFSYCDACRARTCISRMKNLHLAN